jgi:hypothetical protein
MFGPQFPLHLWCRTFGIPSPKEEGISGLAVKDLFRRGEYLTIARYCCDDVTATKMLYDRWRECFQAAG